MFKFAKNREVLWPVTVQFPADGGLMQSCDIEVRYKLLTSSELKRLADRAQPMSETEAADWVAARVTGWTGVADEAGEPLDFSEQTLRALLDDPFFSSAIGVGLVLASRGAGAKNS